MYLNENKNNFVVWKSKFRSGLNKSEGALIHAQKQVLSLMGKIYIKHTLITGFMIHNLVSI